MTKHDRIRSRQDVPTQELYRLCLWRIRAFIKGLLRNKNIEIPEQLQQVQNLERFDYVIWRDLLEDLNRLNPKTGLGLEIAEHVQPKHLGIIAYLALSCENLGEALARYHDFHRLIYDGSPLVVEFNPPYASIRWEAPEPNPTQLTDEIAIALMVQFHKLFLSGEDLNLHEVHFVNTAPKNIMVYEQYFRCKVRFDQPKTQLLLPVTEAFKPLRTGDHTLQQLLLQQAQALLDKLPNSTQLDQRLQHAILTGLQKNQYQIDFIAKKLGFRFGSYNATCNSKMPLFRNGYRKFALCWQLNI